MVSFTWTSFHHRIDINKIFLLICRSPTEKPVILFLRAAGREFRGASCHISMFCSITLTMLLLLAEMGLL